MSEEVKLLREIKKILAVICLSNIGSLKKELLVSELDEQIYNLCTRKSVDEIANALPKLGYSRVYGKVSEWEKRGLLISEEETVGRGRPRRLFIKVEEFLR